MEKLLIYVHGKGGSADEAEHYKCLLSDGDVIGFDYKSQTPWEAKEEFVDFFEKTTKRYDTVILLANSVGAFFSMCSLSQKRIDKALFISPVADMENLIHNMMALANVSEKDLSERNEIITDFGETLSWKYLCYVRENPIEWKVPTYILYGEKDNFTSIDTISEFAERIGAKLTVMPDGEHWFHTDEQMKFLDRWFCSSIK